MKKLKIYSTLLVVFLLGTIVTSVFSFHTDHETVADDDNLEFVPMPADFYTQDSIEGGVVTHFKPTIQLPLYVRAYTRTHPMVQSTWHDKILGGKQTTCVMDMEKLQLKMPASSEEHRPLMILGVVAVVPQFILIVWIVVLAIKLTRRIRKGEVFVADVSKRYGKDGVALGRLPSAWIPYRLFGLSLCQPYVPHRLLSRRLSRRVRFMDDDSRLCPLDYLPGHSHGQGLEGGAGTDNLS